MTLPRYYRCAGIDPGANTGLVALVVPEGLRPMEQARWIGSARIHHSAITRYSDAETEANAYYSRVRAHLRDWNVSHVALEEPWDNVPVRLQEQGTAFTLGARYGLALAAAYSLGCRCMSYPVGSAPAKEFKSEKRSTRTRPERIGWMPMVQHPTRKMKHVQDRNITLNDMDTLSRMLRLRPADGIMTYTEARHFSLLTEDVLMALGVLRFHVNRHPLLYAP